MKNFIHIVAMLFIITWTTTSCKEQAPVTYPDNITGFWEAGSSEQEKWYGLDITDATTATIITYYTEDDPVEQTVTVTYDATTGKGRLIGEGKIIPLKVTTESTLTLTMVEGTVVFYRGVRPKPTINAVGLWKSDIVDDWHTELLVFPKDKNGVVHVTLNSIYTDEFDVDNVEEYPQMMTLKDFDPTTGAGRIVKDSTFNERIIIDITQNPLTLDLNYNGITYTLAKQPKANNMPKSLQGVWKWNAGIASISITVKEDNTAAIYYKTLNDKGEVISGTVNCDVYYCPAAGMGTVVTHDRDKHPEFNAIIPPHITCGIFKLTTATEVNVSFGGMKFKFIKE